MASRLANTVTEELIGRLFKDGRDVTHQVLSGLHNRNIGGADVEMVCGLRCNVIPEIGLRKRGTIDCMACLVRVR